MEKHENDDFIIPKSSRTKIRKSWKLNPKTQVVQSKKKYSRAEFKRNAQREQEEDIDEQ